MYNSLKINDIHKVFDGILKPGILSKKTKGRHSDAFVYFTKGTVKYVFDTLSFTAKAGNVIFLPKNSIYEMQISEESSYICVDFDFEECEEVRCAEIYKSLPTSIVNEFEKIAYNRYRTEPFGITEAFSSLYRIYSLSLRAKYKNYSKSGQRSSDAVKYILERYTDPSLSISDIAVHIGISETHLRRLMKNKINMSPVQYISYLRIEKAKNILKNSNCTITEISLLCGFRDQYYFSREFKSAVGISPSEYRKI